jgi:hypothetical protein
MPILTQRNATMVAALTVAWASLHQAGVIAEGSWEHFVGPVLTAITAFFTFLGFDVTPQGNRLPPEISNLPAGAVVPSPIQDAKDKANE